MNFEDRCEAWLNNPTLDGFRMIVGTLLGTLPEEAKTLAKEFEIASSTVSRWADSRATPHPLLQGQVIRMILRLIRDRDQFLRSISK